MMRLAIERLSLGTGDVSEHADTSTSL
jgi:hypothetical protein